MKSLFLLAIAMLFAVPSFAYLSVTPSYVSFGQAKVGQYGYNQRNVMVRNQGEETVQVYLSGYCGQDYTVRNNCYSLSRNESCDVAISFHPRREGMISCNINLRDSNGSAGHISIHGTGVK